MQTPRLVLITGLPGTGKTTVGRRVADHFGWTFITKDVFKEIIFEGLGWSDKAWSLKVSGTVHRIMDYVIEEELKVGHSIVVESNFKSELDSARFNEFHARYGVSLVQVLCWADGDVLLDRYQRRLATDRHPGHAENATLEEAEDLVRGRCEPLQIPGETIELDTTDLATLDYTKLLAGIASQ